MTFALPPWLGQPTDVMTPARLGIDAYNTRANRIQQKLLEQARLAQDQKQFEGRQALERQRLQQEATHQTVQEKQAQQDYELRKQQSDQAAATFKARQDFQNKIAAINSNPSLTPEQKHAAINAEIIKNPGIFMGSAAGARTYQGALNPATGPRFLPGEQGGLKGQTDTQTGRFYPFAGQNKAPAAQWEDVKDNKGNIIGQRNTVTGQLHYFPAADLPGALTAEQKAQLQDLRAREKEARAAMAPWALSPPKKGDKFFDAYQAAKKELDDVQGQIKSITGETQTAQPTPQAAPPSASPPTYNRDASGKLVLQPSGAAPASASPTVTPGKAPPSGAPWPGWPFTPKPQSALSALRPPNTLWKVPAVGAVLGGLGFNPPQTSAPEAAPPAQPPQIVAPPSLAQPSAYGLPPWFNPPSDEESKSQP